MIVRPWESGDTKRLMIQSSQMYMGTFSEDLDLEPLSAQGLIWTAEAEEGIMGIAGLMPQWENRATAWALISGISGKYFTQIHRAAKKQLIRAPFRRIEATVDPDFKAGHRWVKMLGFKPEGYMRAYRPDGEDQVLYARVRR